LQKKELLLNENALLVIFFPFPTVKNVFTKEYTCTSSAQQCYLYWQILLFVLTYNAAASGRGFEPPIMVASHSPQALRKKKKEGPWKKKEENGKLPRKHGSFTAHIRVLHN
jgi:hypothetical protein